MFLTNRAAEDTAVKGQATKKRPRVGIVLSDDEEDADMDEEDCSDEAAGLYHISLYCDIFPATYVLYIHSSNVGCDRRT